MSSESQAAKSSLSAIQADIGEWSSRNFGITTIKGDLRGLLLIIQSVGVIAHAMLKMSQGIRGTAEEHVDTIMHEMKMLRDAVTKFAFWAQTPNDNVAIQAAPLLGAVEEISEMIEALFDAKLPDEQRKAKFIDGYADLFVFWLDFGARNGFDAEDSLNKTWEKVRQRNWKKDTVTGGESS